MRSEVDPMGCVDSSADAGLLWRMPLEKEVGI